MDIGGGNDTAIVGVHLRRKDYRSYSNGDLYFDDNTVRGWLEQLNSERKCVFLLFSDEEIDMNQYEGLPVLSPKGSPGEDLYMMSLCDYLIGPLSTFSWVAHFLGDNSICYMKKDSNASFEKFNKSVVGVV